jgi:thiamine pyrophosphokinase
MHLTIRALPNYAFWRRHDMQVTFGSPTDNKSDHLAYSIAIKLGLTMFKNRCLMDDRQCFFLLSTPPSIFCLSHSSDWWILGNSLTMSISGAEWTSRSRQLVPASF